MVTLRNEGKLATLNKENSEEHPRSNLARNSNVPRSQEDYITQVSEEIEESSQRSCLKSLVGRKTAFWARYPVSTAFS